MKVVANRDDLICGLFSVYMDNGVMIPSTWISRSAHLVGYEVSPVVVLRVLRDRGLEPGCRPGTRKTLIDRVGEERIREVGQRYIAGDILLKEAARELDSSEPTVNRWFQFFGLSRRSA